MLFLLCPCKNSLPDDLTTVCQVTLQLRMAKLISTPRLFHFLNPSSYCCSQKFILLDSASCSGCWMEGNPCAGSPGWASGGQGGTQLSAEPCLHNHQPPEEFSTCHRKGRNMHHVLFMTRNKLVVWYRMLKSSLLCVFKLWNLCCCHPWAPRNFEAGPHTSGRMCSFPYLAWKDVLISHHPHVTGVSHKTSQSWEIWPSHPWALNPALPTTKGNKPKGI